MKLKLKFSVVMLVVLGFTTGLMHAQDAKKEKKFIKKVAKEACNCLDGISATLGKEVVLEKINECITSSIIRHQTDPDSDEMKETKKEIDALLKAALTAKGDTIVGTNKNITVKIRGDKNFREIQDYMMENCPRMKVLVASDDLRSDKSMSKNPEALKYYHEAEDYFSQEKYDKAIASYKKALEIDPEFTFAWDDLGLTYRKAGNYDEALRCYKKSLEIDPYGTMPLQNMAIVYEYKKDYKQAAEIYEKLIETNDQDPEGYYGAGRAFYFTDDYQKGCDYMFQAYLIYYEIRSPYLKDAEKMLSVFYQDLKEKGQLQIILDAAKKYKIDLK